MDDETLSERKTICVAGKNNIAVDVLYALIIMRERYDYELVVLCNKTETGIDGWQKSLRRFAINKQIPEVRLEDLYECRDLVFLSMEYDVIIDPDRFRSKNLYNMHFSLLPAYKGMYTSALPILHDETTTGVTFHRIAKGIDTGEIIAQRAFPISEKDTARDLYLKYIKYGTELVCSLLPQVLDGTCASYPQPAEHSSYYPKTAIDYKNLSININDTAYGISLQIRAYSFEEYQLPKVFGHKICSFEILRNLSNQQPGIIISETDEFMIISTLDYDLKLFKSVDG